ncbi:MAG: hypothetical protein N2249_03365 [Melioribacter sp.]|nr:hypothetical protein [Melioribacter sp.]
MRKFIIIVLVLLFEQCLAQNVRLSGDKSDIYDTEDDNRSFINCFNCTFENDKLENQNLIAAILLNNHKHLYTNEIYYWLFKLIKTKEIIFFYVIDKLESRVNISSDVLILDNYISQEGIYKDVKISPLREIIKSKLSKDCFVIDSKVLDIENPIDDYIPFLQFYNPDVKITPIIINRISFDKMEKISEKFSKIISEYIKFNKLTLGKDIFILVSNCVGHNREEFGSCSYELDLNSYQADVEDNDRMINNYLTEALTKSKIRPFTINELLNSDTVLSKWREKYPLIFGLITLINLQNYLRIKNTEGILIKCTNSVTSEVLPCENSYSKTTSSAKHFMRFFTLVFYLE